MHLVLLLKGLVLLVRQLLKQTPDIITLWALGCPHRCLQTSPLRTSEKWHTQQQQQIPIPTTGSMQDVGKVGEGPGRLVQLSHVGGDSGRMKGQHTSNERRRADVHITLL